MVKQKNKFSPIIVTATVLVITGFILAFFIIHNYYQWSNGSIQFLEYESGKLKSPTFQDLGNVLGGTVGILFSLAGIIFFAYTIYQTKQELSLNRKEMRLTREAMELQRQEMEGTKEIFTIQLFESTFWNLLNNHKDNILGDKTRKDDLKDTINYNKATFKNFADSLKDGYFSSPAITLFQPKYSYEKKIMLQEIGKSIIHIAKHINKLPFDQREFYHSTFLLNLSEHEKFLIGMILNHKLEPNISDIPISYELAFFQTSPYINPSINGSFPPIDFFKSLTNFFTPHFYVGNGMEKLAEEQTQLNIFPIAQNLFITKLVFSYPFSEKNEPIKKEFRLKNSKTNLSYILTDEDFIGALIKDVKIDVDFHVEYSYQGQLYIVNYNFEAKLFYIKEGEFNKEVPPSKEWFKKFDTKELYYIKFNFFS